MSKSPWFKFYPSDWISDESVALMSLPSRGAYIGLLAYQWQEGSVPADLPSLAILLHAPLADLEAAWPQLAPCFPILESNRQRRANPKLERVRAEAERARERIVEGARRGGLHTQAERKAGFKGGFKAGSSSQSQSQSSTSLLTAFTDEAHRVAVETALRGQHPQAVAASIEALHDGTHRTYPYPVIGRALVELQAAGTTFSASALDAFCRRILSGDPPGRSGARQTQREKNLAVLKTLAEEEAA